MTVPLSTDEPGVAEPTRTGFAWRPDASIATMLGFAAAVIASIFVFSQLRPDLVLADTTPAGGDMGAHVWGPAFLRDNLLTKGQLAGWTPDWYAGFPAYQFYMVVPSLAIIALNAGITPFLGVPLGIAFAALGGRLAGQRPGARVPIIASTIAAIVLVVPLPYGISFKLIAVAGLVFFPLAAWFLARSAGCAEPVPAFVAMAAMVFLFDTNFTIYGGNIASTLAGEFAFSLSLCATLVALGLAMRGMDRNGGRARAALLIALVALCHIIPLFFAMVALFLLTMLGRESSRFWPATFGIIGGLLPIGFAERYEGLTTEILVVLLVVFITVAATSADLDIRRRVLWLLVTGPTAALLTTFWLLPFVSRADYFNDMGWERLNDVGPALLTTPMKIALPFAVIGAVLSFASRDRIGMLFAATGITFASAVANLDDGKLWNARLLPFFYLSIYILAAIGIGLVARYSAVAVSERFDRPDARTIWGSTVAGVLGALILVGMPLRVLPFGSTNADGNYEWLGIRTAERSFVSSWAAWNFSGYEEKPSYREYSAVVSTMADVGETNGCGRAMWEYDKSLDRYGTPMALMLLPHWTDGCIGSMEGLYFESSATTPFHFLNQSALSVAPSSAQRDLPYRPFELDRGIAQLQVMGVRYYMAQSDEAIAASREHPDLIEVAEMQPFVIFQVGGTELVEGLSNVPVVASGPVADDSNELASRFDVGWVSQAVEFYNDPRTYSALPAEEGPEDWPRISTLLPTDGTAIEPAAVTSIEVDTDRISFEVDEIGKPVLVKTSYFPNWQASGADGPFRAGPNLMVVVPTDTSVELSYGRSGVEWLSYAITLLGLAALVFGLRRLDRTTAVDLVSAQSVDDVVLVNDEDASLDSGAVDTGPKDTDAIDTDPIALGPLGETPSLETDHPSDMPEQDIVRD